MWVICLLVLFSTLLGNHTGVILCTGGTVLLAYVLRIIPGGGAYSPVVLTDAGALLSGAVGTGGYTKAIAAAVGMCGGCIVAGIVRFNRKQL